jgi:hypothetical protein
MIKFKIKTTLSLIIILLVFGISVQQVYAGAWTQKKGGGYYKLDFRYLSGENIYDSAGTKIPIPKFTDLTIGAFGSYGITNDFTIFIGAAVFKSVKLDTTASGFENNVKGFGNMMIGGKYRLAKFGKSVVSGKLIFGLPTGKTGDDGSLWIGSKDFSQAIGLEYGYSLYPIPAYLNAGATFTNRAAGISDHFNYALEAGYSFLKNLTLIVRFHGQISFENGDANVKGGFGTFSNNQQFIAYNAELIYKFTDNIGIKGYYESGGAGKNIISAPVLNVGMFFTN